MEEKKEVEFKKLKSESKDQGLLKDLFNFGTQGYSKIIDAGLDVNAFFLLHLCIKNQFVSNDCIKQKNQIQTLLRKQLITEEGKATLAGKSLYALVGSEQMECTVQSKVDYFEKWWKAYPGTDDFEYKGFKFEGGRSLRSNKKTCKIKFANIINEGEYTPEEIIEALEMEVELKKQQSVQTRTNKLSFMQGSTVWLNQRTFEPFVEKIRNKEKVKKSTGSNNTMLI